MTQQVQTKRKAVQRALVGQVSSIKGDKTIHVVVNRQVKHPKYGKYIGRQSKLAVHDAQNTAKKGDMVEIVPCRRISKSKSWRFVRVVKAGIAEAVQLDAPGTETSGKNS